MDDTQQQNDTNSGNLSIIYILILITGSFTLLAYIFKKCVWEKSILTMSQSHVLLAEERDQIIMHLIRSRTIAIPSTTTSGHQETTTAMELGPVEPLPSYNDVPPQYVR
jgi:hypothetical protein